MLFRSGHVTINGEVKQAASESVPPEGWSMPRFANCLASVRGVDCPVLDKTGLTGIYGLTLNYSTTDGDGRSDIFNAGTTWIEATESQSARRHVRDRPY